MGGGFNIANLPKRAGAYFNFRAAQAVSIPPSVGNIVAVPIVHSWGPDSTPVPLGSFADFVAIFGSDLSSAGYRAIKQAFQGSGLPGEGGAGLVLAYRIVGSAGAAAAVTLHNNNSNASALTVTALYKGALGNTLSATVQTNANDASKTDLIVLLGATEVERWTFTTAGSTALAILATLVNGNSDWIALTVVADAHPLNAVSGSALVSGNDGSSLVSGDWAAMETAMGTQRFDYLAPYDLVDGPTLVSMAAWAANLNANGSRFFLVVGGVLNEAISDAVTRALSLNSPDVVTIGVGSVLDSSLLDQNGVPVTLSTSQFAPRLAGIMAALGETRSLSGARIAGATLLNGATVSGISAAFDAGVTVLSVDSNADAPVHVEKGLTTWTNTANANQPYKLFRVPKYVRTLHDIQMEFTDYVQDVVIGKLQVNSKTRSQVVADMSSRLALREQVGAIQTAWSCVVSANPPPSDDDEFVAVDIALAFGRGAEQVLTTLTVS